MKRWVIAAAVTMLPATAIAEFEADATRAQLDELKGTIRLEALAVGESLLALNPFCTEDGHIRIYTSTEAQAEKIPYQTYYRVTRLPEGRVEVTFEGEPKPEKKREQLISLTSLSLNSRFECRESSLAVESIGGFRSTSEIIEHYQAP